MPNSTGWLWILGGVCSGSMATAGQPLDAPAQPPAQAATPAPARPTLIKPQNTESAAQSKPEPPSSAEPTETELKLKDGRVIVGYLVERTDDSIVLSVGGVRTPFPVNTVESLRTRPPIEEQYKALRDAIDENDAEALTRLSEWLRAHHRLSDALDEVNRALKADAGYGDARQLKIIITEQMKLEALPKKPPSQTAGAGGDRPPKAERPALPQFPLLNEEQINMIRVFELDLDNLPKVLISRDTLERFVEKYRGTRVEGLSKPVPTTPEGKAMFFKESPATLLKYIFGLRAREFYSQIKVQDNPRSLQLFRENVNKSWLVNSCSTSKCHGGEDAGRLWLYDRKAASDTSAYTNFLIIERFKTSGGLPLIDYSEPAKSPLLQMGLPRDQAEIRHPEIVGAGKGRWKPTFRSKEDEKFQQAIEWIKAMYPKRTDYPIEYTPPMPRSDAKEPGVTEPR